MGRIHKRGLSQLLRNDRLATPMLLAWLGIVLTGVIWDQVALLPSPAPTPAQLQSARPRALADWRRLVAEVAGRQQAYGSTPEFGGVWTIRSGALCGYLNAREAGIDAMTRFHSLDGRLQTIQDDRRAYTRWWLECLDTRWIELHRGVEKAGFCASRRGRESALGRELCIEGERRPIPPPAPTKVPF